MRSCIESRDMEEHAAYELDREVGFSKLHSS
jgi:hypothetical protein